MRLLIWVLISLISQSSSAMTFTINNKSSALTDSGADAAVKAAMFSMASQMEAQVNNNVLIPESSFRTTLTAFSNATAANNNGPGVSYSGSSISKIAIGAGVSAAYSGSINSIANIGTIRANSLPDVGAGAQASLFLGMHSSGLGINRFLGLDTKKLFLFTNFLYLSHPNLFGFGLRAWNLGLNAQYLIHVPSQGGLIFNWRGIAITTGLRYANFDGSYRTTMTLSQNTTASGAPATLSWTANYDLGVRSGIFTIPIEVTTDLNLFETIGMHFGPGVDLNLGGSSTYGGGSGPVSATSSAGGLTTSNVFSGTGVLDASSNFYNPQTLTLKAILGFHVHLWSVRLLAQATADTSSTYSLYSGIHVMM